MASSDNVKLYGLRETTFGTPASVATDTATAVASNTGGLITFTVSTGTNFAVGQYVAVRGFGDAGSSPNADYDGIYQVQAVGSTSVVVYAPAGKTNGTAMGTPSSATATIGNFIPVRMSGNDTLGLTPSRSESDEITGSRGAQDVQEDGRSAGGGFSGPIVLPWLDSYVQMLSGSPWTYAGSGAEIMATGTAHTVVSTNIIRLGSGSWSGVVVGDMVKIYGGTNTGKIGLVSAVSGGDLTLSHVSLTNHISENTTVVVVADELADGSTIYSETLERKHADIASHFPRLTGAVLDSMQITGGAQQAPSYQMTFQCADEVQPTPTTSLGTGAAQTAGVRINGSTVEAWIAAATGGCVESLSLNWANNLDPRICLGSAAVQGMEMRALSISGNLSRRYGTATEYDKFLANTDSSLLLKFKAPAGPALCVYLPRTNYTSASRGAQARNTSLIGSLDFSALQVDGQSYTARVFRFAK